MEQGSRSEQGGNEMGMSDAQFKTYLLEQLENWQRVRQLAADNHDNAVVAEADKQIEKINTALKF